MRPLEKKQTAAPRYRGCAFLNVATEFPAPAHPARAIAMRNKTKLLRRLAVLAKKMGIRKPDDLAGQLVLLIAGAYMNGPLLGKKGPVNSLVTAGQALMAAAPLKRKKPFRFARDSHFSLGRGWISPRCAKIFRHRPPGRMELSLAAPVTCPLNLSHDP
jgi:hypothetical protein